MDISLGPALPAQSLTKPIPAQPASGSPDASEALADAKQAAESARQLPKTIAGWRMQYIQAVLKALQFYAGQPGAAVERAKQLARQLKGAVEDYTAAGAATPDASIAPTPADGFTGFVADARDTLDQLRAVVGLQRHATVRQGHNQNVREFKQAAAGAAGAIDQAQGQAQGPLDLSA